MRVFPGSLRSNDGEWNRSRIVAEGPRIRTWVNGEPVEDLTDQAKYESNPKGFIGLQVHGVGDKGPYEVAWRGMRVRGVESEKD